jgi:MFS family permease
MNKERSQMLPLVALLGANTISVVGDVMAGLAIPWFVLMTTGSPAKTGLTAFFSTVPIALAAFFGGALVDRLGYKRASILADLASALTVALIPLLSMTVGLEFWQLLVLVFCGALLDAPGGTARGALVPELAGRAGVPLERVGAASDGIVRGARMIGAPLAGLLITVLGPEMVLWLDAASFLVSALLVAVAVPAAPQVREEMASGSYLEELQVGLRFLLRDRVLVALIGTVMIANCLDAALGSVVMPVYANRILGSALSQGLLISTFGGAALVGTIVYGLVGNRLPRRLTYATGYTVTGLRIWILALFPPFGLLLVAHAITGFAVGPLNPISTTVKYERIPVALRARVFGAITAGAYLAIPLGGMLGGYLLEWLDIRSTLLLLGTGYLATTLSLFFNPALRGMDREPAQAEQGGVLAEGV